MNTANIARDPRLVEPKLEDLLIPQGGMRPFLAVDDPEVALDQAFALAKMLENYWLASDQRTIQDADLGAQGINANIHARAMEGISTLIALAAHANDVKAFRRAQRGER